MPLSSEYGTYPPDYVLGFRVKVVKMFNGVPPSFGRGHPKPQATNQAKLQIQSPTVPTSQPVSGTATPVVNPNP